jgi:hypothetical protein
MDEIKTKQTKSCQLVQTFAATHVSNNNNMFSRSIFYLIIFFCYTSHNGYYYTIVSLMHDIISITHMIVLQRDIISINYGIMYNIMMASLYILICRILWQICVQY